MVRLLAILSFVFLLMPLGSFGQSNDSRKTVIVIDPGHGGTDTGAIGINGVREKDMVYRIGKEMLRFNEELFGESFEIYLTRNTDTLISLGDRALLAKKLNADMFISLHCNHSENISATGIEVYVPRKGEYLQKSIHLAYQLQKRMRQNIGFKSRGVKFGNFQVLRQTADYCPTVLLELGFLSNMDEAQHLTEEENVLAIALSILSSLQI